MNYTSGAEKAALILNLLSRSFVEVGQKFGKGREYGAFCMMGHVGLPYMPRIVSMPFGDMPETTRSFFIVTEKVARLCKRGDHWSSYQTRDPDNEKYGGAIRLPVESSPIIGYMGWSSYPELTDEAYMLAIAVRAELITVERAEFIADISGNALLHDVLKCVPVVL